MSRLKRTAIIFIVFAVAGAMFVLGINYYVIFSQNNNIVAVEDVTGTDYILVLGCGIINGKPSALLEDRLITAIEVAEKLPEAKLIVSGNNSGEAYNEVGAMKKYCIENGIDEDRILCDDYGFSTGESITNLSETFDVDNVIIITQRYHLYRALHIAFQYGIEAYGVASNQRQYKNQIYYSLREVAARNKDFVKYIGIQKQTDHDGLSVTFSYQEKRISFPILFHPERSFSTSRMTQQKLSYFLLLKARGF